MLYYCVVLVIGLVERIKKIEKHNKKYYALTMYAHMHV